MTIDELKAKLHEVMAESAHQPNPLSEKEALEVAVDVASEWEMRLDEIEMEELDKENEDDD